MIDRSVNAGRRAKRGIAVELGELFSLGDLKHSLNNERGEGITNKQKSQTLTEVISLECAALIGRHGTKMIGFVNPSN
jgi:hypothetical protein